VRFNKLFLLVVFWFALVMSVACQSSPAKPQSSASSTGSSSSSVASSQASEEGIIFVDESTCREICHVPDANETMAAGAKPQPKDHVGRTACLECHAKMDKQPLPATHVGRMDPACSTCHKPVK